MANPGSSAGSRAAVYVRVSGSKQAGEDRASLPSQRAACGAVARQKGAASVQVFEDIGSGLELRERPGITAVRRAVKDQRVDMVVVCDEDLLSRKAVHTGIVLSECDRHGTEVPFVHAKLDLSTPEGPLTPVIRSCAAEIEAERLRARAKHSREGRVRDEGRLPAGTPPLGYQWADKTPITGRDRRPAVRRARGTTPALKRAQLSMNVKPEVAEATGIAYAR